MAGAEGEEAWAYSQERGWLTVWEPEVKGQEAELGRLFQGWIGDETLSQTLVHLLLLSQGEQHSALRTPRNMETGPML